MRIYSEHALPARCDIAWRPGGDIGRAKVLWLSCLTEAEANATPAWCDWLESLARDKRDSPAMSVIEIAGAHAHHRAVSDYR
jgi:hypothetical protein